MISFLLASIAIFSYISVPVAEMREQPKVDSEVVSQGYFSEQVSILEEGEEWIKVETSVDKYVGWMKKSAVCQREEPFPSSTAVVAQVNRCAAHLYSVQDIIYGPLLTLPFESKLEVIEPKEASDSRWLKVALPDGREGYIQRGDIFLSPRLLSLEEICELSKQFLGLPYTWGGRSSFGYDCSGYVQMLYRQMGIFLPRDTKDQIKWQGFEEISFENLHPGDCIFFGISKGKIRHVGFYLGDNQFIHSSIRENKPYLRISKLTDPEWNESSERVAFRLKKN